MKLAKINLNNAAEMTDNAMKKVVGGFGSNFTPEPVTTEATSCSTTCENGTFLEITDCIGECTATATSVSCEGKTQTLTKSCNN